ncbi:MAG TPA: P-II family nitrogen regulator [Tissierellia bacterium]|nr:P-II family nitrogen regulator [Tissierellia bacterium]
MTTPSENRKYKLFCVIVDFGKGTKVLKESQKLGVNGGTFLLGRGTVRSNILRLLGLDEVRKEIVLMAIDASIEEILHEELTRIFHLDKPNHGIAFSMPIINVIGLRDSKYIPNPVREGGDSMKYEAIFTIVDKGLSDEVIEAARGAGATGGTVIHGRGAGIHEKEKLFNIEIEPEKDIVLILANESIVDNIVNAISKKLNIDKPGAGILFVMDVSRTSGLLPYNE